MHSLNENLFPHLTDFSRPQQLVLLERALNVTAQPKYKVIPKVIMSSFFFFAEMELSQGYALAILNV